MAVAAMSDNRTALERLQGKRFQAEQLLTDARKAGRALAVECGFHNLVTRFYDRLPEVSAEELCRKPTPNQMLAQIATKENTSPTPNAHRRKIGVGPTSPGSGILRLLPRFSVDPIRSRMPTLQIQSHASRLTDAAKIGITPCGTDILRSASVEKKVAPGGSSDRFGVSGSHKFNWKGATPNLPGVRRPRPPIRSMMNTSA